MSLLLFQVVVEDADVGEQFTVVPVQEGEQELSVEVNVDDGIEEPVHGFQTFSAVTTPYDEQPEVIFDFDHRHVNMDTEWCIPCTSLAAGDRLITEI